MSEGESTVLSLDYAYFNWLSTWQFRLLGQVTACRETAELKECDGELLHASPVIQNDHSFFFSASLCFPQPFPARSRPAGLWFVRERAVRTP